MYFSLSALTLSAGFLIYYFLRSGGMLIHQWVDFLRFAFLHGNNPVIQFSHPSVITDFFRYNLPDGLWLLSGLLLLRAVWHGQPKTLLVYRRCFLFFAFSFEISQILAGVPGTFDVLDLITMGSIALLDNIFHCSFLISHLYRRQS